MRNVHIPILQNNTNTSSFYILDVDDVGAINNNIVTLFATPAGSRIRNADFGLIAYYYLNEPKSDGAISNIREDISDKFNKYIDNAILKELDITYNKDRSISIKGSWIPKSDPNSLIQTFTFLIK